MNPSPSLIGGIGKLGILGILVFIEVFGKEVVLLIAGDVGIAPAGIG